MKKTIIIVLVCLLIISTVIAIKYPSGEEAKIALLNFIQTRDLTIDQVILTITYTKEPDCEIIEVGDEIYDGCVYYFEFEYNKTMIEKDLGLSGDMIDEEIDKQVKEYVKEFIKEDYPKEEFKYERKGFLGREIQIKK